MHSTATLPIMLPLRMRNRTDHDTLRAQEQYSSFRNTPFGHVSLDEGGNGGPGDLFREEWNSLATRAQHRNLSLYKSDRNVNPTKPPVVDASYYANGAYDLALQINKKGNRASMLKSPTPRFQMDVETKRVGSLSGPGSYSPERFTGAFPILCEHITPSKVREDKKRTQLNFERAFAILPLTSESPRSAESSGSRSGVPVKMSARVQSSSPGPASSIPQCVDSVDASEWEGLQSTPLKPALTPRNVYSHRANRELVLHHTKT